MTRSVHDIVIVGAGLTGLHLAAKLTAFDSQLKILILEKSKGAGGRMATRRVNDSKYDHGAQFIKRTESSRDLINQWQNENLIKNFFAAEIQAVSGVMGMNQLAKSLSQKLNVKFNYKTLHLQKIENVWQIDSELGDSFYANRVILTCPLPQSLEILKNSNVPFDSKLMDIQYAKALVFMLQLKLELKKNIKYIENFDDDIFSVTSQQEKGLSSQPEYTIVMSERWSETHFQLGDDSIIKNGIDCLSSKFENIEILNLELKKWRYSHPQKIWSSPFNNPIPGIFLAGDAFGGPSLNGAIRSADMLFENLKTSLSVTYENL